MDEGRSAVVLRPAAVSGTRRMGGGVSLPLSLVMDPAAASSFADGVGGGARARARAFG